MKTLNKQVLLKMTEDDALLITEKYKEFLSTRSATDYISRSEFIRYFLRTALLKFKSE